MFKSDSRHSSTRKGTIKKCCWNTGRNWGGYWKNIFNTWF